MILAFLPHVVAVKRHIGTSEAKSAGDDSQGDNAVRKAKPMVQLVHYTMITLKNKIKKNAIRAGGGRGNK